MASASKYGGGVICSTSNFLELWMASTHCGNWDESSIPVCQWLKARHTSRYRSRSSILWQPTNPRTWLKEKFYYCCSIRCTQNETHLTFTMLHESTNFGIGWVSSTKYYHTKVQLGSLGFFRVSIRGENRKMSDKVKLQDIRMDLTSVLLGIRWTRPQLALRRSIAHKKESKEVVVCLRVALHSNRNELYKCQCSQSIWENVKRRGLILFQKNE